MDGLEPIPETATWVTQRLAEVLGYTRLFPPQRQALEAGVERGESLLVAAPTGAGKSFIALVACANALATRGGRAFYVAPLRSIAQEKYAEFRVLEKLGFKVRVSIGDYTEGPPDADVIVSTYEKLDAMLRSHPGLTDEITVLVVDEIHMVGSPDRGPALEGLIARLLSTSSPPQIVALSATIPNAEEIAEWLSARLVKSGWRPVPLREAVFKDYRLHYPDGSERSVRRLTGLPDVDLAWETIEGGGQALVFTQSRRRAASLAKRAADRLGLSDAECREVGRELGRGGWGPASLREELAKLASRCVAYHHAGLPMQARTTVEDAFRRGVLKVVYSTPTLAAGVNLPARRVIVDDYYRYSGGVKVPIGVGEYKQLAGRAGRPGYDVEGEAVIVAHGYDSPRELIDYYILGEPEPVESRLGGLRGLRHMILGLTASGAANSIEGVSRVLKATLYNVQRSLSRRLVERAVKDLREWGLVEVNGKSITATPLGVEVARLYLDPENVPIVRSVASKVRVEDELSLLYLVTLSPDMTLLPSPPREARKVLEEAYRRSPHITELVDPYDEEDVRRLKTALVLFSWVNEDSDDEIYEAWGVAPGDLAAAVDTAEWIASSLSRIAVELGLPEDARGLLRVMALRIKYGVREELLQLVQIPGVGRVKARLLYNAGYRSLHDLASAKVQDLLRIKGVGPATVKNIMEALGRSGEASHLDRLADAEKKGLAAFMED
ncbi:MAG: DEAD/DEAH box helicase [Desulfurococcales archaeon]|nr:DEAD/DEAH box helicase [Desulfurococcales archaeon]